MRRTHRYLAWMCLTYSRTDIWARVGRGHSLGGRGVPAGTPSAGEEGGRAGPPGIRLPPDQDQRSCLPIGFNFNRISATKKCFCCVTRNEKRNKRSFLLLYMRVLRVGCRVGAGASEATARHRQGAGRLSIRDSRGDPERGRSGGRADGPEPTGPVGAPT